MSDTCLMIMNPRNIPECMASFKAITGVDKLWLSYYTESQLIPIINEFIESTEYDRYALISDDAILTQSALNTILDLHDELGDVATGWVNVDSISGQSTINPTPLRGYIPTLSAYSLMSLQDAADLPRLKPIRTYFHGYACTVMSRELWQHYPYNVFGAQSHGYASDFHQCVRLQADDVPIWTTPKAFIHHVKERANRTDQAPEKKSYVGIRTPGTKLEQEA